jgi:ATP-dependent protease Clp ATPase subunit
MTRIACVHCDFCGKSEHEVAVVVRGPKADICDDCARFVASRIPEPTDEEIDAIAHAMPGGMDGFLKGWGWRQFARKILATQRRNSCEKESA